MPTVPNWLIGENLTSVIVTALSRGSGGVLTETTPSLQVKGVTRSIRLEEDPDHEDIRPVRSKLKHNVITGDDATLTLTFIKTLGAINPAAQLVVASNYFKAVFVQGNEQWTGYSTRGRFSTGIENYGANTEELTLRQIDINDVNGSVTVVGV